MRLSNSLFALLLSAASLPALAAPADVTAERVAPDRLALSWRGSAAVDVYLADEADAAPAAATLISADDRDGAHSIAVAPGKRPFFLLRDRGDGSLARVAERPLPLERGSNFRDIGGYAAAGGKHVRWGLIYRSGGSPLLSDRDLDTVGKLHLANLIDLRSDEERQLAPTRIDGVPYHAIGYTMGNAWAGVRPVPGQKIDTMRNAAHAYANFPEKLAPQLRMLFARLLAKEGALAYNCSAGQDRTGFASAMILSALGVPRDAIVGDYLLSPKYRRPQYEMPMFDPAAFPNNPTAQLFALVRDDPEASRPPTLKDPNGKPYLLFAFEAIEQRYGSVDAYLEKALGLTPTDIATLRTHYLD